MPRSLKHLEQGLGISGQEKGRRSLWAEAEREGQRNRRADLEEQRQNHGQGGECGPRAPAASWTLPHRTGSPHGAYGTGSPATRGHGQRSRGQTGHVGERSFLHPRVTKPCWPRPAWSSPRPGLPLQPPGVGEGVSPGKQGDQKEEQWLNHQPVPPSLSPRTRKPSHSSFDLVQGLPGGPSPAPLLPAGAQPLCRAQALSHTGLTCPSHPANPACTYRHGQAMHTHQSRGLRTPALTLPAQMMAISEGSALGACTTQIIPPPLVPRSYSPRATGLE